MPRVIPNQASVEQLRKQAKDLLSSYRRGESEAQLRIGRWFQAETAANAEAQSLEVRLSHAQLAVAREYGFPSWPRLVAWLTRGEIPKGLAAQVELLGVRSWRVIRAARAALVDAGAPGIAAAIEGLSHPNPRVRRGAADFMDHHADDTCVPQLIEMALHDPAPHVRRAALHAVQCQPCKPSPLESDVAPLLIQAAHEDPNTKVRLSAIYGLGQQPRDERVIAALREILRDDTRPELHGAAHGALKKQSPEYHHESIRRAREEGLARYAARRA